MGSEFGGRKRKTVKRRKNSFFMSNNSKRDKVGEGKNQNERTSKRKRGEEPVTAWFQVIKGLVR